MNSGYHIEKQWIHEGYLCAVVINSEMGFRCGYVGVDMEHPFYGEGYDDVSIEAYGGLTFADHHEVLGNTGIWWFGFDCIHAEDSSDLALIEDSNYRSILSYRGGFGNAKTLEFCEAECNSIADQLEAAKHKATT